MANIVIELKEYIDPTGTGLTNIVPMAVVTVDSTRFACATDRMNITLNGGYVELSIESRNIYRYTLGDTYSSVAKTASQMWDSLTQAIAKP